MRNHLQERFISAAWFLSIAAIYAYSIANLKHTPSSFFTLEITLFSLAIVISSACLGFFQGYKSLLQPANDLDPIIPRFVTTMWALVCGIFFASLVGGLLSVISDILTIIVIPIIAVAFLVYALRTGYKSFQLPNIQYKRTFPTWTDRIIASMWFATNVYIPAWYLTDDKVMLYTWLPTAIAAYLGFAYGWRILVLPKHSIGLAIRIGFVGTSYALGIFALLFGMPTIFASLIGIGTAAAFLVTTFIFGGPFIVLLGCLSSLILYALSRLPWVK